MEKLKVPLEECQSRVEGRSMNAMRVKELRQKAVSAETKQKLTENPYLEIWDIDYYSTSDEEDNDSEKNSSSDEDSEVDSEEKKEQEQEESKTQEG